MRQPVYIQNASYKVLDKFQREHEVIEPITLAIIGIILVAAFFAFSGCLMNAISRQRNLTAMCKRPPLFAQWTMRRIINNNTPRWSYSDRRRLFNAVWMAGANSTSEEIASLFYQIKRQKTDDKFIQECLTKQ